MAQGYTRVRRCTGHAGSVLHLDWSADGATLASSSSSYEVLYFELATGRQSKLEQRDTPWATQTVALGFPVMGIWPKDSDGTDVNAVDRSHVGGRHLVTADDFGKVKVRREGVRGGEELTLSGRWPFLTTHTSHRARATVGHVPLIRVYLWFVYARPCVLTPPPPPSRCSCSTTLWSCRTPPTRPTAGTAATS